MKNRGNGGDVDAAVDDEWDDALSSNDPWINMDFIPSQVPPSDPFRCEFSWFLVAVNVRSSSSLC